MEPGFLTLWHMTRSMEQRPSWEADSRSASQEIHHTCSILQQLKGEDLEVGMPMNTLNLIFMSILW